MLSFKSADFESGMTQKGCHAELVEA